MYPPAAAPTPVAQNPLPNAAGAVPTPVAAPSEQQPLVLKDEELKDWWERIRLARQRRKTESEKWRKLLEGYLPPTWASVNINSNVHFRNAHLKIAEVYAQFPELQLTPLEPLEDLRDPRTGQPFVGPNGQPMDGDALATHIVAIKRAVLNKLLGSDCANVDLTILECLFDIFATSGVAGTKICYESDVQPTAHEMPGAATTMPGSILGLQDVPGPMQTIQVPVVVNERFRWYRFSPAKLGIPHDYHSTEYDRAPYLFMEFEEPLTARSKEKYHLPANFSPLSTRDDLIINAPGRRDPGEGSAKIIKGVEIWFHASLFVDDVANYDVFYRLVLIEGLENKAAVYERSPYQTVQGQDSPNPGQLTADSMIGNPIHPITLRVASDLAWIPADAAFTDPLVRQENTYLQQAVKQRDANIPRFVHPASATEAIDKLKNMDAGQGAAISDDLFNQFGKEIIAPIPHLESAQSDTEGHAMIRRAMDETLGTGSNQAGAINTGRRSATETAIVQQNVSVRLKGERTILLQRIVAGVRKFDALVMRYGSRSYVRLEGQNAASTLVMFDRQMISGRYAYDAHPDTMVTVDEDSRRDNWLKWTEFMAKSPFLNQEENARIGALDFGYDPSRIIKTPVPPPAPPPEKPRISFSFSGADLAIPEVRQILGDTGVLPPSPVSPEAARAHMQEQIKALPHGGIADRADTLSKHHQALTGNMDGRPPTGNAAPPMPAAPGAGLH